MSSVLIVDDSLTVRKDLEQAFVNGGFEAHLCADLASARRELSRRGFSLVVLDVVLPDGDGIELLAEIKAAARHAATPVMLLSGEIEVQDRVRGLQTGADEYVGKPYDRDYLVARAREFLRHEDPGQGARERPLVLVIDDSLTAREELSDALGRAGYEVLTAATGEDGLRTAVARRPDAVVVDGTLPGLDGAGVIRALRSDAALRRTPCVLLTGSGNVGELGALEAGADAYVRKEEGHDIVVARLQALLRSSTPAAPVGTAGILAPKKILAVDASPAFLSGLSDRLRGEGFDVVLARSGEEALRLMAVERVDCVLLDLALPGLSGSEACARIKADPALRDVPLLFLTAVEDHAAMVDALNAGADDVVGKSGDFAVLCARIRAQLRRKQFEGENRYIREQLLRQEMNEAEARAAREARDRDRRWLEAIPALAWRCDADGAVIECNRRCLELTGLRDEEALGDGWLAALHPDDRERAARALRDAVARGDMFECEYRVRCARDGSWRWHLARALPERGAGDRVIAWMGTATDIEDWKRAEDALRASEQRHRQLAEALQEADRRKDDFLAVLSHELRNPLAPIRNSLYVLERARSGGDEATRAKAVMARQIDHLTRLIEDLLDVTRISRGKITLQRARTELGTLVRRTVDDHRALVASRGLALEVDAREPVWVDVDPTRVAQIVGNLLLNAAKFTPSGRIRVTVVQEDGRATVHVADTGVGIEPELLGRLFEAFYQVPDGHEVGGLGLGLALVKGLVELHGGTVEARSGGIGTGADFAIRLPLAPGAAAADAGGDPGSRSALARRRVLVIDDNVDAATSLRDLLGLYGHEVAIAHEARTGIEAAVASTPDVVLCDIGLPDMDGYGVARALRARPALRGTLLVALSGYAQPEDRRRSREAGFDLHVSKPPRVDDLEEVLARSSRGDASEEEPGAMPRRTRG